MLLQEFGTIKTEHSHLVQKVDALEMELTAMKTENKSLVSRITASENYTRRDNIIFCDLPYQSYLDAASALPATSSDSDSSAQQTTDSKDKISGPSKTNESAEKIIIDFCQTKLNVNISSSDICAAHRLGSARQAGGKRLPAPIIVRFTNRRIRDAIFSATKQLKDIRPSVYINEHLTSESAALFKQTRALLRTSGFILPGYSTAQST